MERLTYRSKYGNAVSYGACSAVDCDGDCDNCGIDKLVGRLASYEDTGWTPEDIQTMHNELCLKCGQYKDAHLGACNGCRWKKEA